MHRDRPIFGQDQTVWVNVDGRQTPGRVINPKGNRWYLVSIAGHGVYNVRQEALSPRSEGEG
jgi:hypothetical protein